MKINAIYFDDLLILSKPVNRGALKRIADEMMLDAGSITNYELKSAKISKISVIRVPFS